MAQFVRKLSPGPYRDYRKYKPFLRRDFRYRCAYCNLTETFRGGSDAFGADHFRPQSLFPDLAASYSNLYYACSQCNAYKGNRWPSDEQVRAGFHFLDPCVVDPYAVDLAEQPDGTLEPKTAPGQYSLRVLGLNRPQCVRFRMERHRRKERLERFRKALDEVPESPTKAALRKELLALESDWGTRFGDDPRFD